MEKRLKRFSLFSSFILGAVLALGVGAGIGNGKGATEVRAEGEDIVLSEDTKGNSYSGTLFTIEGGATNSNYYKLGNGSFTSKSSYSIDSSKDISYKIYARKYNGPSAAQAVVSLKIVNGNTVLANASFSPSNTSLSEYSGTFTLTGSGDFSASKFVIKGNGTGSADYKGAGISSIEFKAFSGEGGGGSGGGSGGDEDENTIYIDGSNYTSYTNAGCTAQALDGGSKNNLTSNSTIYMDANNAGYFYNSTALAKPIKEFYVYAHKAASPSASISVYFGTTSNPSTNVQNKALSTVDSVYTITVAEGCSYFKVVSTASSKKAQIQVKIVLQEEELVQAGIKAEWAEGKGAYYNGGASGSKISSDDVVVYAITDTGIRIGDKITNGVGFKLHVYSGNNEIATIDATTSKTTSSAIFNNLSTSATYTLKAEMANADDVENPWISDALSITLNENIIDSITSANPAIPSNQELYSDYSVFEEYSGKLNIKVKDTGTRSNVNAVVQYYDSNDNLIDMSDYLTEDNTFDIDDNIVITARVFASGFVGKIGNEYYAHESYTITVYDVLELNAVDGNGADAEYQVESEVAMNPSITLEYFDLNEDAQSIEVQNLNLVKIEIKNSSAEDTEYQDYSGTLPSEEDTYTIRVSLLKNLSLYGTYDINVYDATFAVDATQAKTQYAFGESITKDNLLVTLKYGSSEPTVINENDYTLLDEDGNEFLVAKFIGTKQVTVKYLAYEASYQITCSNVGSSTENVHDDIPGEWVPGASVGPTAQSKNTDGVKKDSIIKKENAFTGAVSSMTVSFEMESTTTSNGGAVFTFVMYGLKDTSLVQEVVSASVEKTCPNKNATKATVTLTISNIPYDKGINGWQIKCTDKVVSGSKTGNANTSNYNATYSLYSKGPDQTFNATPEEQALVYSAFFLEQTNGYCDDNTPVSSEVLTLLTTEYANMVDEAKALFVDAPVNKGMDKEYVNDMSEALTRYISMIEQKNYDNFLGLSDSVIHKALIALGENSLTANQSSTSLILIVSLSSVAAVGATMLLRKRKED